MSKGWSVHIFFGAHECAWGDVQVRHINHMTMEAWHSEYIGWCEAHGTPESDRCSTRTFRNTYDQYWKSILKMREISQHARWELKNHDSILNVKSVLVLSFVKSLSNTQTWVSWVSGQVLLYPSGDLRDYWLLITAQKLSPNVILGNMKFTALRCATCAEFTQRIGRATKTDLAQLQRAQSEHISNVKAHRVLMARLANLSEQSTQGQCAQSLLMISLDGLDQAKTRWPRNLASSKVLERLWRPQMHLIAYICWGVPWISVLELEVNSFKFLLI